MTKTKNALFALPVLAFILIGGTFTPAFAETFICDVSIDNQTINANLVVPEGESCILGFDSIINGNVTVHKDANFTISEQTEINGKLTIKGANDIDITELSMNGNITIVNSDDVRISQATNITGNILLKGNNFVTLFEQSISGNVAILQNGEVDLGDIGIDGNLGILQNGPVTAGSDDFGVGASGNGICLKNESISGEFFIGGNNEGCPTAP